MFHHGLSVASSQKSPSWEVANQIFIIYYMYFCLLYKGAESNESWKNEMFSALKGLLQVLQDDATVSSYELQSTGLVSALLHCLYQVRIDC